MTINWDPGSRRVILADGSKISVPYLLATDQVERWVGFGFDIAAAAQRAQVFHQQFQTCQTAKAATLTLRDFYAGEAGKARQQGVPEVDPDFTRIASAPSAYWWTAPKPLPPKR